MSGVEQTDVDKAKKNERTVVVPIEVEEFHELTSEDEGNESGDSGSNQSLSSKKRKNKDNLANFERKMT